MLIRAEALACYEARRTGTLRDIIDTPLTVGQYVQPDSDWWENKAEAWPIWQAKQPGRGGPEHVA